MIETRCQEDFLTIDITLFTTTRHNEEWTGEDEDRGGSDIRNERAARKGTSQLPANWGQLDGCPLKNEGGKRRRGTIASERGLDLMLCWNEAKVSRKDDEARRGGRRREATRKQGETFNPDLVGPIVDGAVLAAGLEGLCPEELAGVENEGTSMHAHDELPLDGLREGRVAEWEREKVRDAPERRRVAENGNR